VEVVEQGREGEEGGGPSQTCELHIRCKAVWHAGGRPRFMLQSRHVRESMTSLARHDFLGKA
jgi:hypothetical protein